LIIATRQVDDPDRLADSPPALMTHLRVVLPFVFVVSLLACGGGGSPPSVGSTCSTEGYYCQDASTALECRNKVIVALPCKGPNGCAKQGSSIACDTTGSVEGDLCATTEEDNGICTSDGKGILQCRQGAFVKTLTCSNCTSQGTTLSCAP
jgi:hypothetical protein